MMTMGSRIDIFLLFLTLLHKIDSKIIIENTLCDLEEDPTKKFYLEIFKKSTHILIVKISEEKTNYQVNYFTSFFLTEVIKVPATVIEFNLGKFQKKVFENDIFNQVSWSYTLIFMEDVFVFKEFLKIGFLPPRLSYVLIFTQNKHCEHIVEGMTEILTKLWKNYSIINAFSQAPCACNQTIYLYQPFKKDKNGQFGLIKTTKPKTWLNETSVTIEEFTSLKNMNGWPLRASIFNRKPSMMIDITDNINDSCFHCGVDSQVLGTIAKYMNFEIKIDQDPQVNFGSVYNTERITGAMGKLVRAEVDIAGNARFIDQPNLVKYTMPIYNEEMCIVLPKALKKPQWMSVFKCFTVSVWLCILFIEIVCSLFWYFNMKPEYSWIQTFAISHSLPTNTKRFRFKYLLGIYILYSMIIHNIFQSNLIKSFGTVQESYDMKTLAEFAKSSYTIHTSYVNIFNNINSDTFKKLRSKIVDTSSNNEWSLDKVAEQRTFAGLERRTDSKYIITTKFLDETGYPKLHVINECPGMYFLGYAMQLRTPYVDEFNKILLRLMEGGLINKWHTATTKIALESILKQRERNIYKPLTYTDIQFAHYILMTGHVFGTVAMILELFWYKMFNANKKM